MKINEKQEAGIEMTEYGQYENNLNMVVPAAYEIQNKDTLMEPSDNKHKKRMVERFKKVPEKAKLIYFFLIIGLVLSLIIIGLGFGVLYKSAKIIGGVVIGLGLFAGLTYTYGIFAVKWYADKIDDYLINAKVREPEEIDQCRERALLNIFFYLSMLIFIIFFVWGIGCIAFQEDISKIIKVIALNSKDWEKYFGNISYDTIRNNSKVILYVLGVFSLLLSIFVAGLMWVCFRMLGSYRSWQTIIQFVCVLFFQIGFVFLFLSIYGWKYRDVTNVDKSLPEWVPGALLVISCIAIVLGILGFMSTYYENQHLVLLFGILSCIYTIVIIIFSISGAGYINKVQDIFKYKCNMIFENINQDYLIKYGGCDKKYLFISTNLDGMKCAKDKIVTAWEVNLGIEVEKQKSAYGCIDNACCLLTYSWLKSNLNYAILVSFTLIIFGILLVIGSLYMHRKLRKGKERGVQDKKAIYILGIFVLIAIILMGIFIGLIPDPPKPSPLQFIEVDAVPKSNVTIIIPKNTTDIIKKDETDNKNNIQNQTTIIIVNPTQPSSNNNSSSNTTPSTNSTPTPTPSTNPAPNPAPSTNSTPSPTPSTNSTPAPTPSTNSTPTPTPSTNSTPTPSPSPTPEPSAPSIKLKYEFTISTSDGSLKGDAKSSSLKFIESFSQGINTLSYSTTDPGFLSNFTQYFNFNANCALIPAKGIITIIATVVSNTVVRRLEYYNNLKNGIPDVLFHKSNFILRSLQDSSNTIDISKLKEGDKITALNKQVSFSIVDEKNTQIISGRVIKVEGKNESSLSGASVVISPIDYTSCGTTTLQTGTDGVFKSGNFYVLTSGTPIAYKLQIQVQGLNPYEVKVDIGGIGWSKTIDLGDIKLLSPITIIKTTLSSKMLNSIDNSLLSDVSVYLFSGRKEFVNGDNNADANLIISTSISKTKSNSDGLFSFLDLSPGQYSLLFQLPNFFQEYRYVDVVGENTKALDTIVMTPELDEGQIRFVLSWPKNPKDLDIHTLFKVSRFTQCEVFFGKKECGKLVLDIDNFNYGTNGVETITVNTLGKYYYTIAVHKYFDYIGIPDGQTPTPTYSDDDTSNNQSNNDPKFDNLVPLIQSEAKITVYASGSKTPITQLIVPNKILSDSSSIDSLDAYKNNWWLAFCFDGSKGITSMVVVNKIMMDKPDTMICENILKKKN